MSLDHSINFQSLNVVRDELIATIETAARDLENFVDSSQEDGEALQASINGVQQICGILKVLELDSAAILAEELLAVANAITEGASGQQFNRKIEIISNTFFILPRYLEYLEQAKRQLPVVLVPHINALRNLHSESALSECHFSKFAVPKTLPMPELVDHPLNADEIRSEVRRARNMYQIGLTGVLREKQVDNALALMRRGVKRVLRLGGPNAALGQLWFLTDTVLQSIKQKNMALLDTRKFLFMRLDRLFRQLEAGGTKAFAAEPPKGLVKELLYLLALSEHKEGDASAYSSIVSTISLPYTEQELQKEYATLYGPSSHTIASLAHVLNTEIGGAKRTLENAAQDGVGQIEDIESFISVLKNIGEILSVVGLAQAAATLKEDMRVVQAWESDASNIDVRSMADVANTLLYLESAIQDLQKHNFVGVRAGSSDRGSRDAQIASHELSSAIQIVKEECLAGLSLTKRGLSSFSDSNYDSGHIKNISKTLNSIRGAMSLLKKERVTNVLNNSVEFVDEVLMDNELPAAINEVLETFADVIISVEYFFDSADVAGNMDDSVLQVAEESLAALGYDGDSD